LLCAIVQDVVNCWWQYDLPVHCWR